MTMVSILVVDHLACTKPPGATIVILSSVLARASHFKVLRSRS